MPATRAGVESRSGGGGARGGEDAGDGGAMQLGLMARLASWVDLQNKIQPCCAEGEHYQVRLCTETNQHLHTVPVSSVRLLAFMACERWI